MINHKLEWSEEVTDLSNIPDKILEQFPPFIYNKSIPSNFVDLTDKQFHRLHVLYRGQNVGKWKVGWVCQCACEKHTILLVSGNNLSSNNTHSCGCYCVDIVRATCKKYNTYDLSGEYGIGWTNQGEKFYFDIEDFDKIKDYCWSIGKKEDVEARIDGKLIKMHRLIMGVSDTKIVVDHIYHDENGNGRRYDNRKCNLRICEQKYNVFNTKIRSDNTSGVTGVVFDKRRKIWVARIKYCKKQYYIGSFKNKEDAIVARRSKENELFGEYQYKEYIGIGDVT